MPRSTSSIPSIVRASNRARHRVRSESQTRLLAPATIHLDCLARKKRQVHASWPLQEAKNKLSLVVQQAASQGPQLITVRGRPAAVQSAV